MAKMSKENRIKKEFKKLEGIFKQLGETRLNAIIPLLKNASFMAVTIDDLQEIINENGTTSDYQNGENQHGVKKSPEVEIHIAMTKNYNTVMKQLVEMLPAECEPSNTDLDLLRNM